MRMMIALLVLVGLTAVLGPVAGQAPDGFTPPGPNIALNKPYTLEPAPNYGDCGLDEKRTLLTDGVYSKGYFWVQKTTVGWVHKLPIVITFDLGKVEPLAGLSYSTAAGIADVAWPTSIRVLVSDDRTEWTVLGDLVAWSNKRGAPSPRPYTTHRFTTGEMQARGRYLALIVDATPYAVVDEVEIYRGPEDLLNQVPQGKKIAQASLAYWQSTRVLGMVQARLRADLAEIRAGIDKAKLPAAEKTRLTARAEQLETEVDALQSVSEGFTTLLPLNELHTRIYALNAPVLRARGYQGLTAWANHRHDPLQPLQAPEQPAARPSALNLRLMRGEHRAEVLCLTNSTEAPLAATVKVLGITQGLSLRQVQFTDTRDLIPVGSALTPAVAGPQGLRVSIPAGTSAQVWLECNSRELAAGDYRGTLEVTAPGQTRLSFPVGVHVAALTMPSEFSVAIGGWDETNGKGSYDVTPENITALIQNLRDHGVNMPWNNPRAVPFGGQYDAEGNLTAPLDFSTWDEWVGKWQGARHWGVFANVRGSFNDEPMGTPRFNKMVGAWARAWMDHARAQGITPDQIKLLLVDEARNEEHDRITIAWAKAILAVEPKIMIWNDPLHTEPEKVDPDFYKYSGVLSPNMPRFFSLGKPYQDFFVAQREAGRELWFYACSGPAKLLDPATYYRGQFWLNLKYGGKGSSYWAFGDEGGSSWNAYLQARASYSPLFLSKTEITDAKQMEAIREGAQDYEYFMMLQQRVAALEAKGTKNKLMNDARKLLVSGPEQAVATMGAEAQKWEVPKDRTVMDRMRLQALELLEKLSKL